MADVVNEELEVAGLAKIDAGMMSLAIRDAFAVQNAITVISARRRPNETLRAEEKVTAVTSGAASGALRTAQCAHSDTGPRRSQIAAHGVLYCSLGALVVATTFSVTSCRRPKLIGEPPAGVTISTPDPNTNMGDS